MIELTGLSIELFNRRRPGEISRSYLLDFYNRHKADPNCDFFRSLEPNEKQQSLKYERMGIVGKKDSVGQLYVCEKDIQSLDKIVSLRQNFKISQNNPYLFAVASQESSSKWIDLCAAMRKWFKKYNHEF